MMRILSVIVIIAALVGLFMFGLLRGRPDRDVTSNMLGKPAPSFELPVFEKFQAQYGPTFTLGAHKGTPMVVNFWATWCIPCREEAPVLEAYWQQYQDKVLFIGIQTQEKGAQDKGRDFISEFNLNFPNLVDDDSKVSIEYALFGVPETFFIKADGTLMYKHTGPLSPSVLESKLTELVNAG